MFGYVRPVKETLAEEDFSAFRSVYCGLCRTIGKTYGRATSGTLNFDFAFLALLLDCTGVHKTAEIRCLVRPAGKRAVRPASAGLEMAAAVGVILTYHKLLDGAADEKGAKRIFALSAGRLFKRAYKKAKRKMPLYAALVEEELARLRRLERAGETSLDKMADIFASLLSGIPEKATKEGRIVSQILYHTGRWIYILDACDDLKKDADAGVYNPVAARFGIKGGAMSAEAKELVAFTLENSLAAAASSFELLAVKSDENVLRNILYLGMPRVMGRVLLGESPGQKEKNDDRSA